MGSTWATARIQPRKEERVLVALGPQGHTDTLCNAEVLDLRSYTATSDLCAPPPCQHLGTEPKAGLSKHSQLHWPTAKATYHSLGLILATEELLCAQVSVEADRTMVEPLCPDCDGGRQGIHCGSVLPTRLRYRGFS